MASSGALADFSKRPPAFKAAVFGGIAVVLGLLYFQFVYKRMRADIKAEEQNREGLIADQGKVKNEIREYQDLKDQQVKLEEVIKGNGNALPTRAQIPGFFDVLGQQAKASGVQVRRWDYEKELAVEDVFKVPVEIEVAGTYFQIEHFFYLLYKVSQKAEVDDDADATPAPATDPKTGAAAAASKLKVEDRGRILTIENLEIDQPEMTKDGLILTATFRASTFRKEPVVAEEEDPKKKAAADKKAAKAKAKKNLGEQVKDKATDAMDKSDARSRGAGGDDSTLPADRDDKPEATGVDGVKKGM